MFLFFFSEIEFMIVLFCMYLRLVLIMFYFDELIMIGMCVMFGFDVIRFRKCIIVVFELSIVLFMLMLIICVLFLICWCVMVSVLLNWLLRIICVNVFELVMLVCLLMLMKSVLGVMLNGLRLVRCIM